MNLAQGLRASATIRMALVGSGGKTTAMFQLARQLPSPVLVTASSHLGVRQLRAADRHIVVNGVEDIEALESGAPPGVSVLTGPIGANERTESLDFVVLNALQRLASRLSLPVLIEADGSRQLALKAPAEHEPPIPEWVEEVAVLVGLSGLNRALSSEHVHRPERFSALAGVQMGETITPDVLKRYLEHPLGGLKNIPPQARRVLIFNQADTTDLLSQAGELARGLLSAYDSILITTLCDPEHAVHAVYEPIGGVVLAAGAASRYGEAKMLLTWRGKPLVRQVAETALQGGLWPVVVVTGKEDAAIRTALQGLPVQFAHNAEWQAGQSRSIQVGLQHLPENCGAAVFLLADQPQIPATLLSSQITMHRQSLAPLIAPLIDGRRANPVLFDRVAFKDLVQLQGDVGGRAIFSHYPVTWLPWNDANLLLDVDTPEDYQRLMEIE